MSDTYEWKEKVEGQDEDYSEAMAFYGTIRQLPYQPIRKACRNMRETYHPTWELATDISNAKSKAEAYMEVADINGWRNGRLPDIRAAFEYLSAEQIEQIIEEQYEAEFGMGTCPLESGAPATVCQRCPVQKKAVDEVINRTVQERGRHNEKSDGIKAVNAAKEDLKDWE